MLLFSYIVVAALELVMTLQTYHMGNLSFAWSFGFLLLLSIASIPLETSKIGKLVRAEFKNLGVDTAKYDFFSNLGRTLIYILILANYLNYMLGLVLAYTVTFIMLMIAIWKYSRADKESDNE